MILITIITQIKAEYRSIPVDSSIDCFGVRVEQ